MRSCKLNLCHGQQISDSVLDLFAVFEDFSNFSARKCPLTKLLRLANGLISFAVLAEPRGLNMLLNSKWGRGLIFEVSGARLLGARSAHPTASAASVRPRAARGAVAGIVSRI